MSTENVQPEEKAPAPCTSPKRCCKCILLTAFLLALLGFVMVWFHFPAKYEAASWIHVHSMSLYNVFEYDHGKSVESYQQFLALQFALIKSPVLLREVCNDPRVSQAESLRHAKDMVKELSQRIQVQRQGKSEYFTISFQDANPKDAQNVVMAVTEEYMKRHKVNPEVRDSQLLSNLQQERVDLESAVKTQQKAILALTKEEAEKNENEEDLQLTIMSMQNKLECDTKALNKISERIITLQTESRSPSRVTIQDFPPAPTEPITKGRLPLSILVGLGMFAVTLLCGHVFRK